MVNYFVEEQVVFSVFYIDEKGEKRRATICDTLDKANHLAGILNESKAPSRMSLKEKPKNLAV